MKDPSKEYQKLLEENALLKQRIQELQESESRYKMPRPAPAKKRGNAMNIKKTPTPSPADAAELRERAKARLEDKKKAQAGQVAAPLSAYKTQRLLQELQIYQIELEMQNEDLRRIQGELEASRARYFDLYDLAPVGYFTLNEQGMILEINLAAAALLGAAKAALIRQPLPHFILPEDQNIYYRQHKLLFETGAPQVCELRLVKKDAVPLWVRIDSTTAQNADAAPVCRTTMIDITDRKRAEEENRLLQERLNRSEKMESLGMLAGGVAHDLNNVLGVVLGYSELLAISLDKSSPLQIKVENIMKGGERAAGIVQDLLNLARRGVQTRSPVSINDVIMNFLKSSEYERILLCNPRMRVNADLQADILNMMGSKIHLHKTIMNLVSNASDAMPDGGCLNIKTSNQYLDRAISGYDHVREGDYVVLSVSDTGEGISSDDIRHIFEPFYTKKVMGRSGTGLGLAVVWGTVKDHEGYIDVQSEVGKGTTFDLYFPVTREIVSDEKIPVSLSDYMGKGESVLVVDDVKGQRDLASEMLSRLNYKVASVPSGEAAVEYLKANRADILVLDMIMDPGMDGLDTYKEILELYPGQKAIIVSGFSETDLVKKAHRLGAGAYVRKPYAMERLGLAVRRELDKK